MYKRQAGCLPLLVGLLGLGLLVFSLLGLITAAGPVIMERLPFADLRTAIIVCLLAITVPAIFLSPFITLGLVLISAFPEIRMEETGIGYRYWLLGGVIKWQEIRGVSRLRHDYHVILVSRPGFSS